MWLKLCLLVLMVQVLWANKHHSKSNEDDDSNSKSSSSSRELMKRWASRESGERRHGGMSRSRSRESSGSSQERGMWRMKKHFRGFSHHKGGRHFGGRGRSSSSGSSESGSMEEHGGHHRKHGKCPWGHKHLFWRHQWGHKGGWGRHSGGRSGSRSLESGSRSFEHHGFKHHKKHHKKHLQRHISSGSSEGFSGERRHHRGHHGHGRHHGKHSKHGWKHHFGGHRRHHHKKCPAWKPWQQSKCLWPTMDFSSIPEACHAQQKHKHIPQFLQDYKTAKMKEMYDIIQTLFKNRGANKACGYCSRKIQCRVREESEKIQFGCKHKEFKMVDEECDGHEACQLSLVLGGCPAPVPQHHLMEMQRHKMGHRFGQHGQFHHYMKHWGHHSGERSHSGSSEHSHSGEHRRSPRSAQDDDILPDMGDHSNSNSNETQGGSSSSQEKVSPSSQESRSGEGNNTSASNSASSERSSQSGSSESGEHRWGHGHHRNHTALPLWHCVKSKDGKNCLCCCGNYFPDVSTGLCKKVKFGAKLPVFDLWSLTSGGMPTGEHK